MEAGLDCSLMLLIDRLAMKVGGMMLEGGNLDGNLTGTGR